MNVAASLLCVLLAGLVGCQPSQLPSSPIDAAVANLRAGMAAPRDGSNKGVLLCWDPPQSSSRPTGYRVLTGASERAPREQFKLVAEVSRNQRCWRQPHERSWSKEWLGLSPQDNSVWGVVPIFRDARAGSVAEGRVTTAQASPFRLLEKIPDAQTIEGREVLAIQEDTSGAIWFGTREGGVSRRDPKSSAFYTYRVADGLAGETVHAIHLGPGGDIWFGTEQGISRYNPQTETWLTFDSTDGLPGNDVRVFEQDPQGRLWCGTDKGLGLFDPQLGKWVEGPKNPGGQISAIRAMRFDRTGRLFGGTAKGAFELDLRTQAWKPIHSQRGELASDDVKAVFIDSAGAVWFGTDKGASRLAPDRQTWQTIDQGLPGAQVHTIYQDASAGSLWFGTEGGAVSYDPSSQQVGRPLRTTNVVSGDTVLAIHREPNGALWLGTSRGLRRYVSPQSDGHEAFRAPDGLVKNDIRTIHREPSGALWFGTYGGGVTRFDPWDQSWLTIRQTDGLVGDDVSAIYQEQAGALWFATLQGVSKLDPVTNVWRSFKSTDGLAEDDVRTLLQDRAGVLWFGTEGRGVSRYEPGSGSWTTLDKSKGLANDRVRAMVAEPSGALWIGTDGGGLSRYEPDTGTFRHFSTEDGLANNRVRALYREPNGILWIGTHGGVSRFDPNRGQWRTFDGKTPAAGTIGNQVRAIHQARSGKLWFGTMGGGVSSFDPATDRWQQFHTEDGLVSNNVLSIEEEASGAIWFGTWDGGLSRYDQKSQSWRTVRTQVATNIWAIAEPIANQQQQAEDVWFGTQGSGIIRYDTRRGTSKRISAAAGQLSSNNILAIHAGRLKPEIMWFATLSGVSRYDLTNEKWLGFGDENPLRDRRVQAIYEGQDGILWFGVAQGGAISYDPQQNKWQDRLTDGLKGADVHAIEQDDDGYLWFGTAGAGVTRFDPRTSRATSFHSAKDLGSDGAHVIRKDYRGVLWFGTTDHGVSSYDPKTDRWTQFETVGLPGSKYIHDIRVDKSSETVWISTHDSGVAGYHLTTGTWSTLTNADGLTDNDIEAMHQPPAGGAIWMATSSGSVCLYRPGELRISSVLWPNALDRRPTPILVRQSPVLPADKASLARLDHRRFVGLPDSNIPPLAVSSDDARWDMLLEGGWVLSQSGADPMQGSSSPLRRTTLMVRQGELLWAAGDGLVFQDAQRAWSGPITLADEGAHPEITAVTADEDGALWVGTATQRVCRVSPVAHHADCAKENLAGRIFTLEGDGNHGVWVGTEQGLSHVSLNGDVLHAASTPPIELNTQSITSMVRDRTTGILWLGTRASGLFRFDPQYGDRLLSKLTRKAWGKEVISIGGPGIDPAPRWSKPLGDLGRLDSLALGPEGRLFIRQGKFLYDYDTRSGIELWALWLLGIVPLAVLLLLYRRGYFDPVVRQWRNNPEFITSVSLLVLHSNLRALRRMNVAESTIGRERLAKLEKLAKLSQGPADRSKDLLCAVASVLNCEVIEPVSEGVLRILLPQMVLPLQERQTILLLTRPVSETEEELSLRLRDAGVAAPFHVPPIVIHLHPWTVRISGAVVLGEAELRSIGWAAQPVHRLAGLLWLRSTLDDLSPYGQSGPVKTPNMFYGRKPELEKIQAADRRRALLVIGPRKSGKSSLLKRAQAEFHRNHVRVIYAVLRSGIANPAMLGEEIVNEMYNGAEKVPPELSSSLAAMSKLDYQHQAMALGAFIRRSLRGAVLLFDESDEFVLTDHMQGGAAIEELRALTQEDVCTVVLAGFTTLYQATLSQKETVYNFGEQLLLGSLEIDEAVRLATEPMDQLGIRWATLDLPERLVDSLGAQPELIQATCQQLLRRVRTIEHAEPTFTQADLTSVLSDWDLMKGMRGLLIGRVESNLNEPARAVIWLLAQQEKFSLEQIHHALETAGFKNLTGEQLSEVTQGLQLSGVCHRKADDFQIAIPLLREAVAELQIDFRVARLVQEWQQKGGSRSAAVNAATG